MQERQTINRFTNDVSFVPFCGGSSSQGQTIADALRETRYPAPMASTNRCSGQKLTILHVTPIYEPAWNAGGVVRTVSILCRSLARLGHKVDVVTTDSDGTACMEVDRCGDVQVGGVRVRYVHTQMPRRFRYARGMNDVLRERVEHADIVHLASFWNHAGALTTKLCEKLGVPCVISTHGTFLPEAMANGRLRKWVYLKLFDEKTLKNAAAYHYTTDLERRKMDGFRPKRPSFLIPNGLDLSELAPVPNREESRKHFGLDNDDFVVGFLGRLHEIKALDVLISGVDRAVRAGLSHIEVLLAGPDGGAEDQLKKLVVTKNLSNHVRFLGPVHGEIKKRFLAALDVVSLVSWTENFGNAAAEAMAMGVPALVSENVGLCDIVQQDGGGVVIPVDEHAVASALEQLAGDVESRRMMGQAAKAIAWTRFEADAVASLMAKAYADVLTGKRSPECNWQ